jgi:Skp family chaperone for outer membrane proteins
MLFNRRYIWFLDADGDAGGGGTDPSKGDPAKDGKKDFEAWLAAQPEDVRAQYETHVKGLKSALQSERDKSKGIDDKLKRLAELEEAEAKREGEKLTEKEKLQKALAAKDAEIAEVKAAGERALEAAKQALIRATVTAQATGLNFIDADDAMKLADLSGVTVDGDKVAGVKEALEALAKAKPHLLKDGKQPPGSPPKKPREGDGHRPPPPDTKPARPVISF